MILSFAVENFGSIRDRQELIFEATLDKSLESTHVHEVASKRILKGAALYGANASGKSSLLDAMIAMRSIVLTSASQNLEDTSLPINPFLLNTETQTAPTEYEVEFLVGEMTYRYGFSHTEKEIVEEWLYRKKPKIREAKLFHRTKEEIKPNSSQFPEGKEFIKKTRSDVLFLRTCAEWNADIPLQIIEWFRRFRHVSGVTEAGFFEFTAQRLQESSHQQSLLKLAQKADFNIGAITSKIENIQLDDLPSSLSSEMKKEFLKRNPTKSEIKTQHTVFDKAGNEAGNMSFDLLDHESQGTCKFVALSGPLEHTLEEGSILIIDEFEARLHPNLTKALLEWFMGPRNTKGAQLIFATHDTGLMIPELLRRDQIWFCEKDEQGATSLYCLDEFDSDKVRPNTRFNRQYLQGIFGAVPNVALNEL